MTNLSNQKVIRVTADDITFSDGYILTSEHSQDCCEHHYLSFADLSVDDFQGLIFDLTDASFFTPVPDYGIRLNPVYGFSISVPGYGSNNGYYSTNLTLVLTDANFKVLSSFDISDCQEISE